MVLKIHGNYKSTSTQRVATICYEKGVPFELVRYDLEGVRTPEFKGKLNPFGQMPVLEDDGYLIFESRAIGRYIALKYANQGTQGLLPTGTDLKEVTDFETAMSVEASQFVSADLLVHEALFKKFFGLTTDPALVAKHTQDLENKMDAYESMLAKTKYLAGDHVTLADLFHLPYGELVTNAVNCDALTSPKRPNVARWWKDISSRESWQAAKKLDTE